MKKKFCRILGVGLTIALLVSLMAAATPAAADPGSMAYGTVAAPSAKNQVLQAGTDVDLLAVAPDGTTMFAYFDDAAGALYKSTDAGVTWKAAGAIGLPTSGVLAMAVSPNYEADATLIAADTADVWYSSDGGANFASVAPTDLLNNLESGAISSIDIGTYYSDARLSILVGVTGGSGSISNVLRFALGTWLWTQIGTLDNDVLAVSFSPAHMSDAEIVAVSVNTTASTTNLNTQFGTNDWDINVWVTPIVADNATGAVIAFGADYMGLASNTVLVGIQGTSADDDVYRISGLSLGTAGTATDLNVAGSGTTRSVKSIAVSGPIATAKVMVGLTNFNVVYRSSTVAASQTTWYSSATAGGKSPTGTAGGTTVLWAGDAAYVGTTGDDSAFSKSTDDGKCFNQLSLIDVGSTGNMTLVGSTIVDADTIFLIMDNGHGGTYANRSLFATTDGGSTWQRILTGASLEIAKVSPDYAADSTLYVADTTVLIRKSSDGGATFTVVGSPAAVTALAVVDKGTYFTGADNGRLYKSGRWASATGLGTGTVVSIVLSDNYATDDTILVGNGDGDVYISTDDGVKFTRVGAADSLGAGANVTVAFDPDFATNSTIYAGSTTNATGVMRATSTSTTATWKTLDTDGGSLAVNGLVIGADGTLYAASGTAGKGIRRCLDPTTVIDIVADTEPYFESLAGTVTTDPIIHDFKLSATAELQNLGLIPGSNVLYAIDSTKGVYGYGYTGALLIFTDTLTAGPAITSPSSHMKWQSRAGEWYEQIGQISTATTAKLDWKDLDDADSYTYKYDSKTDTTSDATSKATIGGTESPLTGGKEYCWTVRVQTPVLSRWSVGGAGETCYKFITALEAIKDVEATYLPIQGASKISVTPSFSWPSVSGATGYEFILSADSDFGIVEYAVTVTTNTFVISEPLEYSATYYWGVRASSDTAAGEAWRYLSFTTGVEPEEALPPVVIEEAEPAEPAEVEVIEVPVQTIVQQAIPTYLLWIIVGIGAVLFIALIVLVVRTRRVA